MAINSNGSLLQVAYGGYVLTTPSTEVKEVITTESYVEPGFTTSGPIEFAISKSDQFYFIIRKRDDIAGTSFENISASSLDVSVIDATLGMDVEFSLSNFSSNSDYYDTNWDDGLADNKKIILAIDSGTPSDSPIDRIRIIDCQIKHRTDDTILFFRILVDDFNKTFYYIDVNTNLISQRTEFATAGSTFIKDVDGKGDSYVLISPFASFHEVDKGGHDFSYPLNTIFYTKESTFNQEDFSYSINAYSNSVLLEDVRVKNVPGYSQMGVIIIDKNLYNDIISINTEIYIDIEVRGLISEMTDIFRINFVRV